MALEEVHLFDSINIDTLDLLHERCGHYSKSKLLEGFKHMMLTGSGLTRAHLSKSFSRSCVGTYYVSRVLKGRSPEGPFGRLSQRFCQTEVAVSLGKATELKIYWTVGIQLGSSNTSSAHSFCCCHTPKLSNV